MRSVDTDSLLANIPLEEIANICCKTLFKNTRRVQVILKITFKEKFSGAINESYSIFHWKLYKQGDGVAMGSLFGPTFASLFLFISLILSTYSFIDASEYSQAGLIYTLNYFF